MSKWTSVCKKQAKEEANLERDLPIVEILVFAAVQPALASMTTSSRFNILTGTRTIEHFRQATRDFRSFFLIAVLWLVISTLVIAKQYGWKGGIMNFLIQGLIIWWIARNFWENLLYVARKLNFEIPKFFGRVE